MGAGRPSAGPATGRLRPGGGSRDKGKDKYSDTQDDNDDEVDLLRAGSSGRLPGLRGVGESDGAFDEGWTGNLPVEEEEITGLLTGSQVSIPGSNMLRSLGTNSLLATGVLSEIPIRSCSTFWTAFFDGWQVTNDRVQRS